MEGIFTDEMVDVSSLKRNFTNDAQDARGCRCRYIRKLSGVIFTFHVYQRDLRFLFSS